MNNAKFNQISIRTLNALNKIELFFEDGEMARDLEHAAFIAKSEHQVGQMKKTQFFHFRGYIMAVVEKQALFSVMFEKVEGGYLTKRIDYKTYNAMEAVA